MTRLTTIPNSRISIFTPAILALVLASGACGSDDDSTDGDSPADAATNAGADADTNRPDANPNQPDAGNFADTACFAASDATSADCTEICARESACDPPFATCMSGCRVVPTQFDLCTQSTNSCEDFRACLDCGYSCTAVDQCSPAISEVDCCNGCYSNPQCVNRSLPTCEGVDGCL